MSVGLEDYMGSWGERVDLSTVNFTPELLRNLPRHLAWKYRALPISESADSLGLAVADPRDLDVMDSLTYLLKRNLEFRSADEQQLDTFIRRLYGSVGEGDR